MCKKNYDVLFSAHEAVGCADFKAPENSVLKREGDALVISCTASGRSYRLRCADGEWVGSLGNCPKGRYIMHHSVIIIIFIALFINSIMILILLLFELHYCFK